MKAQEDVLSSEFLAQMSLQLTHLICKQIVCVPQALERQMGEAPPSPLSSSP